jgi:hypothetical protein
MLHVKNNKKKQEMWQGQINEKLKKRKSLIYLEIYFLKKNHKENDNIKKKMWNITNVTKRQIQIHNVKYQNFWQ